MSGFPPWTKSKHHLFRCDDWSLKLTHPKQNLYSHEIDVDQTSVLDMGVLHSILWYSLVWPRRFLYFKTIYRLLSWNLSNFSSVRSISVVVFILPQKFHALKTNNDFKSWSSDSKESKQYSIWHNGKQAYTENILGTSGMTKLIRWYFKVQFR